MVRMMKQETVQPVKLKIYYLESLRLYDSPKHMENYGYLIYIYICDL